MEDIRSVEAGNGKMTLAEAMRVHPSVVLLDIKMPALDGLSAAKLIVELPWRPKVILMSVSMIASASPTKPVFLCLPCSKNRRRFGCLPASSGRRSKAALPTAYAEPPAPAAWISRCRASVAAKSASLFGEGKYCAADAV